MATEDRAIKPARAKRTTNAPANPVKSGSSSFMKAGAVTVALSFSAVGIVQAVAATATLPVLVNLIRAIDIAVNTALDFGTLAVTDARGGFARLDPETDKLTIDGNSSITLAAGKPRAGKISIKGAALPVAVSVENQTIHLTNGVSSLTVSDFNFISNGRGGQVTISPTGADNTITLSVGATVNARVGQLTGSYVGSNRIFANYQ